MYSYRRVKQYFEAVVFCAARTAAVVSSPILTYMDQKFVQDVKYQYAAIVAKSWKVDSSPP